MSGFSNFSKSGVFVRFVSKRTQRTPLFTSFPPCSYLWGFAFEGEGISIAAIVGFEPVQDSSHEKLAFWDLFFGMSLIWACL